MTWYYVKDGEPAGPISDEELISKLRMGSVLATALVWRSGMSEWEPASKVAPQLLAAMQSRPAATAATTDISAAPPELGSGTPPVLPCFFCTFCGTIIPADQLVRISARNVCGMCKPLYVQQISEGIQAPVKVPILGNGFDRTLNPPGSDLADPWLRLVAHILDLVFIGLPIMLGYLLAAVMVGVAVGAASRNNVGPAMASGFAIGFVVFMSLALVWIFFYWTFFLGRRGATPGMKIMKLRMVRGDRGPLNYGRAFGRAVVLYVINAFTMSLTNISAFFDREGRTVVDMICDTRVVRS